MSRKDYFVFDLIIILTLVFIFPVTLAFFLDKRDAVNKNKQEIPLNYYKYLPMYKEYISEEDLKDNKITWEEFNKIVDQSDTNKKNKVINSLKE